MKAHEEISPFPELQMMILKFEQKEKRITGKNLREDNTR